MEKVVFFGDSILSNFGTTSIEILESSLSGVDIYNCAVGGWNTIDGVHRLAKTKHSSSVFWVERYGDMEAGSFGYV